MSRMGRKNHVRFWSGGEGRDSLADPETSPGFIQGVLDWLARFLPCDRLLCKVHQTWLSDKLWRGGQRALEQDVPLSFVRLYSCFRPALGSERLEARTNVLVQYRTMKRHSQAFQEGHSSLA